MLPWVAAFGTIRRNFRGRKMVNGVTITRQIQLLHIVCIFIEIGVYGTLSSETNNEVIDKSITMGVSQPVQELLGMVGALTLLATETK